MRQVLMPIGWIVFGLLLWAFDVPLETVLRGFVGFILVLVFSAVPFVVVYWATGGR